MNNPIVLMNNISKRFPGVKALDDCSFELLPGEVHGLVGENGAGKSTLMKILTGIEKKDEGTVLLRGAEVNISSPRDAQTLGISIIHQELNMMPHLTAAQNIFIGREAEISERKFFTTDKSINKKAQEYFDLLNVSVKPNERVGGLTVAKQQMIEIAKALSYHSDIIVMDEPSAALTEKEINELFKVIRQITQQGVSVIYISHRLEELFEITDRVTVMRDGEVINTVQTSDTDMDAIIQMMVGREVFIDPQVPTEKGNLALEVKHLSRGRFIKDVSFSLCKGEIVGMSGLVGAGRTEVARAIFGADKLDSGEIFVNGEKVSIKSPNDAVSQGIGYLSEDRKNFGLLLQQPVDMNLTLANTKEFQRFGIFMNKKKTAKVSTEYVKKLNIRTPGLRQKVRNLSGGNQQKVVLGKWLIRDSDILIFDEPTRGIDVGAKSEIYNLLNDLATQGKAIIMISSELPEIMRMSHRVLVMCEGRLTGELSGDEITQEAIMRLATDRS